MNDKAKKYEIIEFIIERASDEEIEAMAGIMDGDIDEVIDALKRDQNWDTYHVQNTLNDYCDREHNDEE